MSKTYCRFCEVTVKGLYLNCPKCGKWLMPGAPGDDIDPEPYESVMDMPGVDDRRDDSGKEFQVKD